MIKNDYKKDDKKDDKKDGMSWVVCGGVGGGVTFLGG